MGKIPILSLKESKNLNFMTKNILPKNHFFLTAANEIESICNPLKNLGIHYFTYLKSFRDNSQIYLSNSAQWIDDYYNLTLYETSFFERSSILYKPGYFMWPQESGTNVFLHGRDYFDSGNGVTIIQKNDEDSCEFFFFSGKVQSTWLTNFYLNNIDLLEKFIHYFKDSAGRIIRKAERNRIKIYKNINKPDPSNNLFIFDQLFTMPFSDKDKFLKAIKMDEYASSDLTVMNLSSREKEVALNVLRGRTALQIANNLDISKKTVERHIENIKNKLNCNNKSELIKRLLILENNSANLVF